MGGTEGDSSSRIELVWPGKGGVPLQDESGKWAVSSPPTVRSIRPFVVTGRYSGAGDAHTGSLIVGGDRLDCLRGLRRLVGGRLALVYGDIPRIEGFDETRSFQTSSEFRWSTWMSVVKEHLSLSRQLLAERGAIVVHLGDGELGYGRLVADEVLGIENFLGTVVWQTHYSPKGGKPTKDIAAIHDHLLFYAANRDRLSPVWLPVLPEGYSNPDGDPNGDWEARQKDAGRDTAQVRYHIPPYRWELVKGQLPPGLWQINPFSGVIAGTPTQSGSFTFTIKVSDKVGQSSQRSLTVRVAGKDQTESGPPHDDTEVWWQAGAANDRASNSKPKILSGPKLRAHVGTPFRLVVNASGGSPWTGKKRPSRGWAFGEARLTKSIIDNTCYFGKKGDAIPEPKRYLKDLKGGVKRTNLSSWWSSDTAGRNQDATKHLNELMSEGVITRVPPAPKPQSLLARLIEALTEPGDLVMELFCRSGDLAVAAAGLDRPFVALGGGSLSSLADLRECAAPRILDVTGHGRSRATSGGNRAVTIMELGGPFACVDSRLEYPLLDFDEAIDEDWLARLLSLEGYLISDDPPVRGGVVGRSLDATASAVAFHPDTFLDRPLVSEVLGALRPTSETMGIYYFRSSEDLLRARVDENVRLCRIPMDLGGW